MLENQRRHEKKAGDEKRTKSAGKKDGGEKKTSCDRRESARRWKKPARKKSVINLKMQAGGKELIWEAGPRRKKRNHLGPLTGESRFEKKDNSTSKPPTKYPHNPKIPRGKGPFNRLGPLTSNYTNPQTRPTDRT